MCDKFLLNEKFFSDCGGTPGQAPSGMFRRSGSVEELVDECWRQYDGTIWSEKYPR